MLVRRGLALLGALTLGSALLGAVGCGGGLSTGDHVFYWVAVDAAKPEAACYPDMKIPDSLKDDVTTIQGRSTFALYITGDKVAELDTGTAVLSGTETDTGYSFQGDTTNVEYPPGKTITDADHDGTDDAIDTMIDADHDGIDDKTDMSVDTDKDGQDDRFEDTLVDADMDGKDDRQVEVPSGIKLTSSTTITIDLTIDGDTVAGTATSVTATSCDGKDCPKNYATSCTQTSAFSGIKIEQTEVHVGDTKSNTP